MKGHIEILNAQGIEDKADGERWCGILLVRKRNREGEMAKSNSVEVKLMDFYT